VYRISSLKGGQILFLTIRPISHILSLSSRLLPSLVHTSSSVSAFLSLPFPSVPCLPTLLNRLRSQFLFQSLLLNIARKVYSICIMQSVDVQDKVCYNDDLALFGDGSVSQLQQNGQMQAAADVRVSQHSRESVTCNQISCRSIMYRELMGCRTSGS